MAVPLLRFIFIPADLLQAERMHVFCLGTRVKFFIPVRGHLQAFVYPAPEKLKILIDINLNLATGLRSKPAE